MAPGSTAGPRASWGSPSWSCSPGPGSIRTHLPPRPWEPDQPLLWQIGKTDGDNAEFALAPGGYGQYKNDGFYVVGSSESEERLALCSARPDRWLGRRSTTHTFVILFGLKAAPTAGDCRLAVQPDRHTRREPAQAACGGQRAGVRTVSARRRAATLPSSESPRKACRAQFAIAFPASAAERPATTKSASPRSAAVGCSMIR